MPQSSPEQQVISVYSAVAGTWGRQHWWPARSRFEVIVGAYLTQNTNWTNVELALRKMRSAGVLNAAGIRDISLSKLEGLVRSSGYFRQKARRLKVFVKFLDQSYGGSLNRMFAQPTTKLREQLLALNGVGPETADSILLYAGQHPIFVVDAYTKRIAGRHGILAETTKYEDFRLLFERALSGAVKPATSSPDLLQGARHSPSRMSLAARTPQAQVFNDMHGLLVGVGKNHCLKSRPRCDLCPLKPLLPQPQPQNTGL